MTSCACNSNRDHLVVDDNELTSNRQTLLCARAFRLNGIVQLGGTRADYYGESIRSSSRRTHKHLHHSAFARDVQQQHNMAQTEFQSYVGRLRNETNHINQALNLFCHHSQNAQSDSNHTKRWHRGARLSRHNSRKAWQRALNVIPCYCTMLV